ncbi:Pycsar system effector family protein [Gracilimonas sp.]|uniref:Pycsar system effector family protein n=1 Tax=Gracilimonas sp. TaxID=1974203 RepID=UPI0032EB3D3D
MSDTQQEAPQAEEEKKDLGSRKRGVSDMFRTSYRTHIELSAIADNKSNIMISINGIIISIIIASISPKIDSNPWLLIPTSILLVTCMIALVYSVLAARPRVSKEDVTLEDVRSNRSNILFFGNFNKLNREDYVTGMEELMTNSERLYDTMARDLYGLGSVLSEKYRLIRIAYNVFMVGLVLSVSSFILVYLLVSGGAGF